MTLHTPRTLAVALIVAGAALAGCASNTPDPNATKPTSSSTATTATPKTTATTPPPPPPTTATPPPPT